MKTLSTKEWIAVVAALVVTGAFVTGAVNLLYPVASGQNGTDTQLNDTQNSRLQAQAQDQNGNDVALSEVTNLTNTNNPQKTMEPQAPTQNAEQLSIQDVVVGTGAEAKAGDKVTVHYTGTFTNGTKFDSSLDRGQPFDFTLGAQQVIKGWDLGVAGMKVGGTRKLTIPPTLGYGAQPVGPIPANSTLLFTVELLAVNGKK